jgi:chromate reductase, NAD(P)H dehydrogenase (quinone)
MKRIKGGSVMGYTAKILAFAGSTRIESFNKKLVKISAAGARKAGAQVTYVDLKDFPMPLYDGDLEIEQGLSDNGHRAEIYSFTSR